MHTETWMQSQAHACASGMAYRFTDISARFEISVIGIGKSQVLLNAIPAAHYADGDIK